MIFSAKDLKELGNFNGLMAVFGGLSNSILDRMYKTKDYLSNEDKLVSVFAECFSSQRCHLHQERDSCHLLLG